MAAGVARSAPMPQPLKSRIVVALACMCLVTGASHVRSDPVAPHSEPIATGNDPAIPPATASPSEDRKTAGRVRKDLRWVTRSVTAPRVTFHTFDSELIGGKVSYHLYRPAAYDQQPERRFPVIYWLHGSGGGTAGIAELSAHFDRGVESGKVEPFLVVFVNGLPHGMYVDWKDGSAPIESLIVGELLQHVDRSYRTIADRKGRLLEGFSMGGYGAARLGFKHRDQFGAVSILGAGPMQERLLEAPRAGRERAERVLARVYGGNESYFREVGPRRLAERYAEAIAQTTKVRVVIGDRDETLPANVAFHEHLSRLKIPHEWIVLKGVAHDPMELLRSLGEAQWAFYRRAFESAEGSVPAADAASHPARAPTQQSDP